MNIVDFISPLSPVHVAGQKVNAKFRKLSKKKLNGNDGERERKVRQNYSTNDKERERESLDYAICLSISIYIQAPPNYRTVSNSQRENRIENLKRRTLDSRTVKTLLKKVSAEITD